MDLTASIEPKSDQQNADDFMAGPRTFTIESVTAGSSEQPINVNLIEAPGKPYKPSKSMRRVLVMAWGAEGSAYAGRRLTLARDPHIKFGGIEVGGIIITHLSDLAAPLSLALTVTRGKRSPFAVKPLTDAPTVTAPASSEPTEAEVAACDDLDVLRAMWKVASPERRTQIEARTTVLADDVPPPAQPDLGEGGW